MKYIVLVCRYGTVEVEADDPRDVINNTYDHSDEDVCWENDWTPVEFYKSE